MEIPAVNGFALRVIKVVHTAIWAFFASCIFAIPILARRGDHTYSMGLIGVVFLEVLVLVLNRWECPLTTVAARHTTDRRDNFDIFLPTWLARHNKLIFGALYIGGSIYAFTEWQWAGT